MKIAIAAQMNRKLFNCASVNGSLSRATANTN